MFCRGKTNGLLTGIKYVQISDNYLTNNKMNIKWFERKGIFFIPVSIFGWLIALAAIGYCVYLFIDIDSRSHSASDTLMNFVFNAFLVAVVYSLIAFFTSNKKEQGNIL
jgi:hypothetical protein